jgi:hypothetical protein
MSGDTWFVASLPQIAHRRRSLTIAWLIAIPPERYRLQGILDHLHAVGQCSAH